MDYFARFTQGAKTALAYAAEFASDVCCAQDGSWGHGLKY